MTVQFNIPGEVSFEAPLAPNIYASLLNKNKIVKEQSDWAYVFQMYYTTSEQKPLKWIAFDSTSLVRKELDETYDYCVVKMKELNKQHAQTGFKVVCIGANLLNSEQPPAFFHEYSHEKWEPTVKVFVNGPKKKPFPMKASKHYT